MATIGGAAIAFTGTVLADRLRHRNEVDSSRRQRRRDLYVDFIVAAGLCHTRLRQLAEHNDSGTDQEQRSRAALTEAGIYEARERLFIDGTPAVTATGQTMFERLRALRRAVGNGAKMTSAEFHEAYHPYLAAVWAYRAAVRRELGSTALAPSTFGWPGWDGSETCSVCTPDSP
ncbi:hypothetical protein Prum_021940 [Phytohabitans rumicis]|uniref:CchlQ n=1 Tax=Phytohabitans rumicis TaxID=1076125 RepID=A0A6V8KTY0_9ACTN|nr:hypothetical protein Prum_021940 [Phytohabitans rumicis]